ncbi:MAG: radical SAM family heme chaperone HemW [Clostridia bacterium]|nr:radical SAM family heme chaperone HemW [Clostridia bacterium]
MARDYLEKKLGLYIHIPFCMRKCLYCDFYSIPAANEQLKSLYLEALMLHFEEHSLQLAPYVIDSIYFGGGTPSLLTSQQISMLLRKIKKNFFVSPKCEITLETNPGTVDKAKISEFRKSGVNRLSIGCQSFYDSDLQTCGRIHNSADNIKAVDDAVNAGFKNINVDIMYGLPGQSLQNVLGSIERAVKLGATHISLYGLKVEEGTPFYAMQTQKKLELPDEDTESDMYFVSCNLLKNLGFKHYEISNFAKPGFESVHNLKYWNCDEYVGFGPSAHSFFSGKRFYYKNSTSLYIKNFTENYDGQGIVDKCIDVQFGTQMAEYVMLRMRLGEGINCDEFKRRFGRTFESVYLTKMTPFLRSGHIVKTVDGYAFTEQGMYVSNYILSRMIDFDIVIPGV